VKQLAVKTPTDYENMSKTMEELFTGSTPPKHNPVRPDYYTKEGLECYSVQRASMGLIKYQGYLEGCAQKYLWRWEEKNGKQDLKKAVEYLVKLIETLE